MNREYYYSDDFFIIRDKTFVEHFFEHFNKDHFYRIPDSDSVIITSKNLDKIIGIVEFLENKESVIITGMYFFQEFNAEAASLFFSRFTEKNIPILFATENTTIGLGQLLLKEGVAPVHIIKIL